MADKLTPLIIDALARAAAEPAGAPLYATKTEAGLFPNVSAAKPAARKCLDDGLLQLARTDAKSKPIRELYSATDKGLNYLVEHASAKEVLDDFVRLLEERRGEVRELLSEAKRLADGVDTLTQIVGRVAISTSFAPKAEAEPTAPAPVNAERSHLTTLLLAALRDWTTSTSVSRDCPLPELYRSLAPLPSIGEFHDALRQLHTEGRLYLHPWTGPLYALPHPPFALLVGHEIAYYASAR